MSATDELRRMLDERGVEWESKDVEGVSCFHDTRWNAYGVQWCYVEFVGNNYTKLKPSSEFHCTPEQAITATLGNSRAERTCHWELEHSGTIYDKWRCSKCGYLFVEPRCDQGYTDLEPNYCPNCGCKVIGG